MSGRWLLLRGLSREQRHWGEFPAQLATATGMPTTCLDLPGVGTERARPSPTTVPAMVDDVRARFANLKAPGERWSILAISLGGMLALDWGDRFPEELERIVVINTSAGDLSPPWARFAPRYWRRVLAQIFLGGDPVGREEMILEMTANRPDLPRAVLAREWAAFAAERPPHIGVVVRQLVAATRSKAPTAPLRVPTLILTSRGDRLVSSGCSEVLARRLGAPLVVHETAGHDLPLDASDWVCDQVVAFQQRRSEAT